MVLTAAERSKRYREKIKQDPVKHELHKKKELKRLKKHFKKINDLTEEEKDARRKRWREQKRNQKENKKISLGQGEAPAIQQLAPTEQQSAVAGNAVPRSFKLKLKRISKSYTIALNNIQKYKTALNNIRKKLYRAKKQHEKEMHLLQTENDKLKARQEVMEVAIREAYTNCNKNPERRVIKSIALKVGEKMNIKPERNLLGLKGQVRKTNFKSRPLNKSIVEDLEKFYNRDDISRSTAGKRETRTKNKRKVQIRYLVDTLQNLYKIYKNEGGKHSFTTFFRYKPYYVLSPSATTRNTCMCIKHSNIEFMFNALKLKGVLLHKSITELLNEIACDTKSFDCMYNKCYQCKIAKIQYNEDKLHDEIAWFKWGRVIHTYVKSGQEVTTKKTTKQQIKGTVLDLIAEFKKELPAFKTHCFNWIEQQRQYRACVTNMKEEEIGILCDFSENYECKYGEEIQSMHFGASKNAISLHCGVIFGNKRSQSFVTVSDDNCHEPHAIWAHLMPVLKLAKDKFPNAQIIHFFSDGPSTQYRQKKNFYLLNLFTQKLKLTYSTWSFSEAGHGKSMADGIGGSVKRQLDKRISYGHDIINATEACHVLQNMKSVKCLYISESDIHNFKKLIPDGLRAVPGTMQLHQIISVQPHEIQYRTLSCFCGEMRGLCNCYNPKVHLLTDQLKSITVAPVSEDTVNDLSNLSFLDYTDPGPSLISSPVPSISLLQTDLADECSFLESTEAVPVVVSPNLFETYIPPTAKEIHQNLDNDPIQPIKKVKVLKPLQVQVKFENQNVLRKRNASSRTFPCHVCKTRQSFILQEMAKCMVCSKWVCISCSGTTSFDYICSKCLGDDE